MLKKAFRSALSLLLALCLVLGLSANGLVVFAEELGSDTESENKTINYVSIGDSMTNGYGLDGYTAEAGVYDYGYYAYANQFAAALAGITTEEFHALAANAEQGFGIQFEKNGVTVNHSQLGLSAARPEDINFLLNLDYNSQEVIDLLDKYPDDDLVCWSCGDHSGVAYEDIVYCAVCKWDPEVYPQFDLPGWGVQRGDGKSVDDYEAWWTLVHGENWQNLIGYGDFWTWKELTEDYRFGTAATYIKSVYGTDAEKARAAELMANRPAKPRDDGSNGQETAYVAKHFQEQIANADVVSLGIGNGNFGVWLMGRITTALMDYDGVAANNVYNVDDALSQLDENDYLRPMIEKALVEIDPYINEYIDMMMGDLDADTKESVKGVCTYAVVSFMVNYRTMVERILELNPDVEIVMLGLMNTYAGDDALAEEGQVTIGNILDVMFPPLNAYIAALPTLLQSKVGDATFYYAEEYSIECLIQNFGDEAFYNWEGVSRDRFVVGIVGECDCGNGCVDATACGDWDYGIFWELLDGYEMGGVEIQRINQADIKAYEALDAVGKVKFAAENKDKAGSIAVYLAIEDAICKSGRLAPVTLATLTGLELGNPAILSKALGNFATEQEKIIADYYADAIAGLEELGVEYDQSDINDMSMILSLPVALSNALWTDMELCSMLAVVARNKLGNGLGAHPSVNGHAALAEEMIHAYQTGYSSLDKTMENVKLVIDWMVENGYLNPGDYADYAIDAESAFVALGNGAGYAGALGEYLTGIVDATDYGYTYSVTDLTVAGSKITDLGAVLEENRDVIAGADLVTLGCSNDVFAEEALYALFDAMLYGTTQDEYDWVALLGEELAAYVEEYLVELKTSLDEQGMNVTLGEMLPQYASFFNSEITISEAMMMAVEHYAYHTAAFMRYVPEAVADIHEMNADTLVVVVGMGNPFLGMRITMGEDTIDLGEMMSELVKITDRIGLGYAMVIDNVVFVSAPEAETNQTGTNIDTNDLLGMLTFVNSIMQDTFTLEITEQGNAYILEQIQNALNVTVEAPYQPEEPGEDEVLFGDINGDTYVDVEDAMLVLQLEAMLIEEDGLDLNAADVNGDGWVDVEDAMLILQYDALLIEKFPVEE